MKRIVLAGLACASLAACGGGETDTAADEGTETIASADETADAAPVETEDATVPGTEYNATSIIDCSFDGASQEQGCEAGVIRNWGEDGTHLVEVQKPDGFKRAIFFDGTTPTGADSAESDGSAGWDFETSREGDRVTITYGPESYVIVDALITGG